MRGSGRQDGPPAGRWRSAQRQAATRQTVPRDVVETCKSLESNLQSIFNFWSRQSQDLSAEELEHISELKSAFDADSEILYATLRQQRKAVESVADDVEWVQLTYDSDDGTRAPYWLNPETGEIRWEDYEKMEISRGLSMIPEQLEKYHESVRKVEYASRRDRALKRQQKVKPPKWPWELFRTGAIFILIAWAAALTETIIDKLGLEPPFTPLVN